MIAAAKSVFASYCESKSQVFFLILVSFIAGIALRSFVHLPIAAIWVFFIFGIGFLAAGAAKFAPRRQLFFCGLFVIAFTIGMMRHIGKTEITQRNLDSAAGSQISLTGIIDNEPARSFKNQKLIVKIPEKRDQKILVTARPYPEFSYGDEIRLDGTVEKPENFTEDFDYEAYLAKDDVYYVMRFPKITFTGFNKGNSFYGKLFSLKRAFSSHLNAVLPEPEASFADGLILGERRAIPQKVLDEFAETGTTHIIALSGYNITIVASAIMRVLGLMSLPMTLSLGFSAFGIVLFTMLTGASASVVRASIMGLLVLLAQKEGRVYSIRNALALAGAVMLFQNPSVLRFDTSFQLSFLATLGLLYVSPVINRGFENIKYRLEIFLRNREFFMPDREVYRPAKISGIREILISTLSAQFLVLPLLLKSFGRLSLVSPVANLLVLPLVPLEMFLSFVTGALGFFSISLAQILGWASWIVAHYQLWVIDFLSNLPAASFMVGKMSGTMTLALYLIMGLWLWRKTNNVAAS